MERKELLLSAGSHIVEYVLFLAEAGDVAGTDGKSKKLRTARVLGHSQLRAI